MPLTMYLGLEGVVCIRRDFLRFSRSELAKPRIEALPLMQTLALIVSERSDLAIVLNSWLIADFGYRGILKLLPDELAAHTIGATMQGNRAHRRRITLPRVDVLRADISRRRPARLIIVESVQSAIPFEHLEQAVVVDGASDEAQSAAARRVAQFLSANGEGAHSPEENEEDSKS